MFLTSQQMQLWNLTYSKLLSWGALFGRKTLVNSVFKNAKFKIEIEIIEFTHAFSYHVAVIAGVCIYEYCSFERYFSIWIINESSEKMICHVEIIFS